MENQSTPTVPARAVAIVAACIALSPAALASGPDVVYIRGIVRDFPQSHPDFNVTDLTGHVAGNVALAAPGNRPSFTGGGFEVGAQWRDRLNRNIAPHLALPEPDNRVMLVQAPTLQNSSTWDTYDSTKGPYGATLSDGSVNIDAQPTAVLGASIPAVTLPASLPALVGEMLYDGSGTTTLDASVIHAGTAHEGMIHCEKFLVRNGRRIVIKGNVTLIVREEFKLENVNTKVELADAFSTLTIYALKDFTVQNQAVLNPDTTAADRVVLYRLGNLDFKVQDEAMMCATVVAPLARLYMQNSGRFFGKYTGRSLHLQNNSSVHIDCFTPTFVCAVQVEDTLGVPSGASSGGITSSATFGEWFTDVLGLNVSYMHTFPLVRDASGIYEYLDNAFFPIDNMLLGNEGAAHNFNFTFMFSATFEHDQCAEKFFEFYGADDAWVYIDGKLAMDLGGVHPLVSQTIDIDRLGLIDGETYRLHFYFAQRNPYSSVFQLRTNLVLESATPFSITAQYD